MEFKIKMNKKIYKAWDSLERKKTWIAKQLVKLIKEKYGLEKTK